MRVVPNKTQKAKGPLKVLVWAKVSEDTSKRLGALVDADDRSVSYLVRKFVEEGIARLESEKAA